MLGHELRNPLAPIRNAVAVLKADESPDSTANWAHQVIDRQVSHLSRIVDDLLDIGRISTGKIAVNREPVDLAIAVARVVETVHTLFEG
jgi:signal transduction histidine kinase